MFVFVLKSLLAEALMRRPACQMPVAALSGFLMSRVAKQNTGRPLSCAISRACSGSLSMKRRESVPRINPGFELRMRTGGNAFFPGAVIHHHFNRRNPVFGLNAKQRPGALDQPLVIESFPWG